MLFTPLKPMIVSIGKEAFDDERFIFEPKYDGWRMLIHKQRERVEAYTRYGNLVTGKFPELREMAAAIKADTAILDCEGICLRGGRPVFDDFAYRGRLGKATSITQAAVTHPATFVAFDVLYTGERECMSEPLMQRKERLADIVIDSQVLTKTMAVDGAGQALFALTKEKDMEGIVAKRKDSKYYMDKTSPDWLKIKHFKTIDVIILGYRTEPFALAIGLHFRTVKFKPVGTVEFGFGPEDKQAFLAVAQRLHTDKDRKTQWIEPRLCCRIEYLERTDTHQLRTAIFRGFLPDKRQEDCVWPYL
ncbi:ATP-dependent DNA ligase [Paenibacillus silvisoli]|uniref:ATP-dependent DNA ligase n=1 Tax=Paenibacillus silvisoli TaxID=3110539 RepID=UPI002805BEA0|nr:DNA ligase [Paenibacillus silvisoli]